MTGQLLSNDETIDSSGDSDEFFVPIKAKSSISEDRLVIAIEGSSLKPLLPEVRWGARLPIYLQIIDYDPESR